MGRVIYHIENRGSVFIYHWFMYMISGLRYTQHGGNYGGRGDHKFEQNKENFNGVSEPPFNIFFSKNPSYKEDVFFLLKTPLNYRDNFQYRTLYMDIHLFLNNLHDLVFYW